MSRAPVHFGAGSCIPVAVGRRVRCSPCAGTARGGRKAAGLHPLPRASFQREGSCFLVLSIDGEFHRTKPLNSSANRSECLKNWE